jgi:hypothetical protein
MNAQFFGSAADLRDWFERNHETVSANRPETRERRPAQLIADSAAGRKIPPLVPR